MTEGQGNGEFTWTPEAEEGLKQVPDFAQETARERVQEFAQARGQTVITGELWREALAQSGRGGPGA